MVIIMTKKIFKVVLGVFVVICSLMNYNKALDFAADAIIDLLPKKEEGEK